MVKDYKMDNKEHEMKDAKYNVGYFKTDFSTGHGYYKNIDDYNAGIPDATPDSYKQAKVLEAINDNIINLNHILYEFNKNFSIFNNNQVKFMEDIERLLRIENKG